MQVTLYQFPGQRGLSLSPFANKVHFGLRLKGIPYETRTVRTPFGSPTRRIPYVDLGGERILDSTEILLALDRLRPEPSLVPRDPALAARARLLEDWADESLAPLLMHARLESALARRRFAEVALPSVPGWLAALMVRLRALLRPRPGAYYTRLPAPTVRSQIERHLDVVEAHVQGREWLVGDVPTIADIGVAAPLYYLLDLDVPLDAREKLRERPHTCAWLDRFLARVTTEAVPAV